MKKFISRREVRVFVISTFASFILGLTPKASAYWTDNNITVPTSNAITSATYVPPPTFGACTSPTGNSQNFQTTVIAPTGFTLKRNPQTDPPVGTAGTDAYEVTLTRNSGGLSFNSGGSPTPTLNTTMDHFVAGVDTVNSNGTAWFGPNGIVWGFVPISQAGLTILGTTSVTGSAYGQLQMATMVGSWKSVPASLSYRIDLQTNSTYVVGVNTGNSVVLQYSGCPNTQGGS